MTREQRLGAVGAQSSPGEIGRGRAVCISRLKTRRGVRGRCGFPGPPVARGQTGRNGDLTERPGPAPNPPCPPKTRPPRCIARGPPGSGGRQTIFAASAVRPAPISCPRDTAKRPGTRCPCSESLKVRAAPIRRAVACTNLDAEDHDEGGRGAARSPGSPMGRRGPFRIQRLLDFCPRQAPLSFMDDPRRGSGGWWRGGFRTLGCAPKRHSRAARKTERGCRFGNPAIG